MEKYKTQKIVLHFHDGSTKTIMNGFAAELSVKPPEKEKKVLFHFAGVTKPEIVLMIRAVFNLAVKLGVYGPVGTRPVGTDPKN